MTLPMLIIILFSACTQDSILDVESKTAVIQGYLYADQGVDSILVTQSFSYAQSDTNIQTLDDLEITLSGDGVDYPLFPAGSGLYHNPELVIKSGQVYRMAFSWQGKTVSAETYIPEKKEVDLSTTEIEMEKVELSGGFGGGFPGLNPIDPIDINWDNAEGDYYYVVIKNIEEAPEYINELIAQFEADNGGRRPFSFISRPEITNVYSINPQRDLTQYGTYQIVVYRVNPEYAALYESSGNSTLSLVQPPNNVSNGLGLLTGVSSDTVYLEVKKI